jgi:hypothetical protein
VRESVKVDEDVDVLLMVGSIKELYLDVSFDVLNTPLDTTCRIKDKLTHAIGGVEAFGVLPLFSAA